MTLFSKHRAAANRSSRVRPLLVTLLCAAAVGSVVVAQQAGRGGATPVAAAPVGDADKSGPSFAVRAKAVYPVSDKQPGAIDGGVLIVRNGKIAAVGADLPIPADIPLIDLRNEVICPGFVAAASAIVPPHAGPHSISGAYQAVDGFDAYGDYAEQLALGITTAHISPGGHRLASGRGAIVKLAGPAESRIVRGDSDLSINLGVYNPPRLIKPPFYASSDVAITPARRQGPESRIGQLFQIESVLAPNADAGAANFHTSAFTSAWSTGLPLRIQARQAVDVEDAVQLALRFKRPAYLVGAAEADELADSLATAGMSVVLRLEQRYRGPDNPVGPDPTAFDAQIRVAGRLAKLSAEKGFLLALAGAEGDGAADPRMSAALAMRGGMSAEMALGGITRTAAAILKLEKRVGSLAPGMDADFLVMSGRPLDLDSQVMRTYVGGELAFDASAGWSKDARRPVVIKGGTVWVGNGSVIEKGAVLLQDGKIRAVGQRVPRPPLARIVEVDPDAFIVPGFIDAHGHLGLEEIDRPEQARTTAGPEVSLAMAIGAAGREFARVARSGVTTVMLAAYRTAANGSRVAAIKTYGRAREDLVTRETAGVKFTLAGADPLLGVSGIRDALEAGKKYEDSWKKYHDDLEKWKKERESGTVSKPKEDAETKVDAGKPDPITGTWEFTLSGGPMPEPVKATMKLKLTDGKIEGRATSPQADGEEVRLTGALDGDSVTLEIDEETGMGRPTIKARLDREDHMAGQLKLGDMFSLTFEATRTDKAAVEFKIERTRKRGKDGRPQPPAVDERLEPIRPLLAGKVPAVVEVRTAAEARAALKLLVDQYKIPVVLLDAPQARDVADDLLSRKEQVGVVVPSEIVRRQGVRDSGFEVAVKAGSNRTPESTSYNQAADLAARGVRVAFQSNAEDGARALPLMGLFAVQQGLGGDEALRAFTIDAARMYRIDDRVGTLEAGKDADVLVFHGHPFDAGSRLERVFVAGQEVEDE